MLTLCAFGSWDDTQEGRRIKISKTGKLNIYIAVDISPSMDKQSISEAISLTLTLIEKVRNVASCRTILAFSDIKRWFIWTKNSYNAATNEWNLFWKIHVLKSNFMWPFVPTDFILCRDAKLWNNLVRTGRFRSCQHHGFPEWQNPPGDRNG